MNWAQLRAMLWLRWRLTRNQWRRGGQLNAVITLVAGDPRPGPGRGRRHRRRGRRRAGLVQGVAAGRSCWCGTDSSCVFLFFWTMGIVTELQRSEIIDLSRLLHLPVSLRDVFLLNYLASHFSLSLAMVLPAMLGLAVGLVLGRGPAMVLLFPLVFGFFFMITAWTYCLRGWLAALMVNKRRRRAIIMGITMAFVLLAQLPNLMTNVWIRGMARSSAAERRRRVRGVDGPTNEREKRTVAMLELAHRCVPLLWLPQGAKGLAEGRAWPALSGACRHDRDRGAGVWRAPIARTLRFYHGGKTKKARSGAVRRAGRSAPAGRSWSNGRAGGSRGGRRAWRWPASARCPARRK